MGYTCGLYLYPMFSKIEDISENNIDKIKKAYAENYYYERLLEFNENDWAIETFNDAEEYVCAYASDELKQEIENLYPTNVKEAFFKNYLHKGKFEGIRLNRELDTWCSSGKILEELIKDNNIGVNIKISYDNSFVIFSKTDVLNLLEVLLKRIKEYNFAYCHIDKGFKYTDDECSSISLFDIDGIEFSLPDDENNLRKRICTDDEFVLPLNGFRLDEFYTINSAIECCLQVLKEKDDNLFLVFSGGY